MKALVKDLERRFMSVTAGNYPYEWDENHITYSLMKEMRELFVRRRIRYKNFEKFVDWTSFKNKGNMEYAFGDITLLVNIQFSTGERLRGVSLLEAKRDAHNGNFESITLDQLERIHSNAPYSHLLLYLHNPQELQLKFPDEATWTSHVWTSPLNTANRKLEQLLAAEYRTTLRVTFPFSMFITSRLFWGLDLDYRDDAYRQALEGLGEFGPPRYLGIINVYYEGQAPVQVAVPDIWDPI